MYISLNQELIEYMQKSEVLKRKLSPTQFQKFFETALALPKEQQQNLLKKLQAEHQEVLENKKNLLKQYEKEVQNLVKQEQKKIEIEIFQKENLYTKKLLKQL